MVAWLSCGAAAVLLVPGMVVAQSTAAARKPYASIAQDGETYDGPGGGAAYDVRGPVLYIGLLAPLHGAEQADGDAVLAAARLALQDAGDKLPSGQRLEIATGDESGPSWGHVAGEVIRLALQQNALALITATNGADTHLTEQVGNRIGIPVLTISGDPTTTEGDVPWIFRLGASDDVEANAILQSMDRTSSAKKGGAKKVLLVTESTHDGLEGSRAVDASAQALGVGRPESMVLNSLRPDFESAIREMERGHFQAAIVWTRATTASVLLGKMRSAGIRIPVYLSKQAAQPDSGWVFPAPETGPSAAPGGWSVLAPADADTHQAERERFIGQYVKLTGRLPGPAAQETYDAVRLTVSAVHAVGPNRDRIRKWIAGVRRFDGVSGTISFDSQGNCSAQLRMVRLIQQAERPVTGDSRE
jgi:branched-chain amino acid transport system substrate-binding protein